MRGCGLGDLEGGAGDPSRLHGGDRADRVRHPGSSSYDFPLLLQPRLPDGIALSNSGLRSVLCFVGVKLALDYRFGW